MRHISMIVCSLGLLSAAVGCCCEHMAGVCDCEKDPRGCERYNMGYYGTVSNRNPALALTPVPAPATNIDAPKPLPVPQR
jgi:hypothetical protein